MAATGYTPIYLYYSSTATNQPSAGNLGYGELAINITDGYLYYKDNANAIQKIGYKLVPTTNGGTGLTSFTANGVVYASSTSALTTGSGLTYNGTNLTCGGGVYAAGASGFLSTTYVANARNPIWRFGNASDYGMSYFQGSSGISNLDTIGLHFGTATAAGSPYQFTQTGYFNTLNGTHVITNSTQSGSTLTEFYNTINATPSAATSTGVSYGMRWNPNFPNRGASVRCVQYGTADANGEAPTQIQFWTYDYGNDNGANRATIFRSGGMSIGNTTDPGATNLSVTGYGLFQGITVGKGGGAVSTNTAVGYQAQNSNSSGGSNVSLGYQAGYGITTGSENTCIGYQAGYFLGNQVTTGSTNTYVGYGACASGTAPSSELVIAAGAVAGKGSSTGLIYAGVGGVFQGNNTSVWATTSDARIKENVVNIENGLATINALRPVEFDYIETKQHDIGWLAQEYMEVLPDQVRKHSANPFERELVGEDEIYGIIPNLVPYLVKAVQELSDKVSQLEKQLGA